MPLLAGAVFVMVMSEALIVAPKMLRPSTVYDSLGLSKKTNETFNGYMKAMKDPEFDCMFFKGASVNDKGPFYGVRLWPRVHHCMGGLEINEHAQVMSVRGTPIKGLYAAGEATGGVHGMVRLGTVAVADCMIFGRIAARDAFKKA